MTGLLARPLLAHLIRFCTSNINNKQNFYYYSLISKGDQAPTITHHPVCPGCYCQRYTLLHSVRSNRDAGVLSTRNSLLY